jgi:hypothetical protein
LEKFQKNFGKFFQKKLKKNSKKFLEKNFQKKLENISKIFLGKYFPFPEILEKIELTQNDKIKFSKNHWKWVELIPGPLH